MILSKSASLTVSEPILPTHRLTRKTRLHEKCSRSTAHARQDRRSIPGKSLQKMCKSSSEFGPIQDFFETLSTLFAGCYWKEHAMRCPTGKSSPILQPTCKHPGCLFTSKEKFVPVGRGYPVCWRGFDVYNGVASKTKKFDRQT